MTSIQSIIIALEYYTDNAFTTTEYKSWIVTVDTVRLFHHALWEKKEELHEKNPRLCKFICSFKPDDLNWLNNIFRTHPVIGEKERYTPYLLSLFDQTFRVKKIAYGKGLPLPEIYYTSEDLIKSFPLPDYGDRQVTEDEYYHFHNLVYGFWLGYIAGLTKVFMNAGKEEEEEENTTTATTTEELFDV